MAVQIKLEDIEEMRIEEGIDDVELREEIRSLRVGDQVKLTLLTGPSSFETLIVRITSIRGDDYQGKLARKPTSNYLTELEVGALLRFSARHIHSILPRKVVQ